MLCPLADEDTNHAEGLLLCFWICTQAVHSQTPSQGIQGCLRKQCHPYQILASAWQSTVYSHCQESQGAPGHATKPGLSHATEQEKLATGGNAHCMAKRLDIKPRGWTWKTCEV